MFGRAHLPLILLAAAPCHAQAAPATLTELRRDVAVMLAGAADAAPDPAAVARLCLAARELAATIDPVHGDALLGACSQLTDALLGLSWHGQGLDAARDLHEAYRRAMTRGLLETTTHHRRHAETSLLVGDLATLRAQAKLGQRKNEPESVFERCLLQVLATRLHCQLGRLEQAERHLGDAQKCAVWLQQRIEQDGHAPEPYGAAIRNTIMAAADYHLLTGN
ncbi:MAG: hypothetical protein KAI24_15695, partial [Planctomycetes bacterium]|nr:hypothetical protein [Planctomycetota bacterium]